MHKSNTENTSLQTAVDLMSETMEASFTSIKRSYGSCRLDEVKLIRKLRWIGMEEEANILQKRLAETQHQGRVVCATPIDTD